MTAAHTAVALALLAGAAAIQCPDASWFAFEDKCYSAQARATHAECATICGGSNASLVHIESQDENDFVRFLADDNSWIGYYKVMSPKGDECSALRTIDFQPRVLDCHDTHYDPTQAGVLVCFDGAFNQTQLEVAKASRGCRFVQAS